LRIALVSGAHPPEFLGGTELAVAARARELVARGHEVVVVCGSAAASAGYHPREERVEGVRVVRLPKTEVERGRAHWRFARLARLVDQATHGHDLVHLHHWQGLSGDLVRRIAGETIRDAADVRRVLAGLSLAERIDVECLRPDGEVRVRSWIPEGDAGEDARQDGEPGAAPVF